MMESGACRRLYGKRGMSSGVLQELIPSVNMWRVLMTVILNRAEYMYFVIRRRELTVLIGHGTSDDEDKISSFSNLIEYLERFCWRRSLFE